MKISKDNFIKKLINLKVITKEDIEEDFVKEYLTIDNSFNSEKTKQTKKNVKIISNVVAYKTKRTDKIKIFDNIKETMNKIRTEIELK